jgi:hypothetical protein
MVIKKILKLIRLKFVVVWLQDGKDTSEQKQKLR